MKQLVKDWELLYEGGRYSCDAPCSYYDTLIKNGFIADPHYRDNEKEFSKLYGDCCTFETEISVSSDMLSSRKQEIVFEGIDTLAEVYLNGVHIGSSNNMHRTYVFDVKGILKQGENKLTVDIRSAVTYFREMQRLHPMRGNGDTLAGFAHVRKAFYMSGWDWGPTLPDMGIWRPVYLRLYDSRIEDVEIRQTHRKDGSVLISCKTDVDTCEPLRTETVICDCDGREYRGETRYGTDEIVINDPKLWWPNGYGEQPLYTVTVRLLRGNTEIDRVTKTVGLRTITISQDKDTWGSEFCFKINGIKIFAMGTNYIPEENMLSRRSPEKTEYLIKRCVEANNNVIRVWGGGIYPDDWFFDLCDRYGLIVWQDFMFACNLVWLTETMEQTIKAELADNIKRIRHHASLGLLCGNNENEEFMIAYMKSSPLELEKADYLRLYCHIIPDACAKYAPDTFYWSSSPSSGTPLYDHANDNMGDRHVWTVWGGLKNIEEYKKYYTRFCSEFGFQSLPDIKTIEGYTLPEDRNLFSEVMERHQKNRNGNGKLMFYMSQYYKYPTEFEKLAYATQLLQERAVRTAVEHFRRNRGRCMGTMYWQLNDCWPVASWACIDYNGRPKALYYCSKDFFAPVLISANVEGGSVTLNVSSERRSAIDGRIVYRLKDTKFNTVWEKSKDVEIAPLSACDVAVIPLSDVPADRMRNTFLEYELYSKDNEFICRGNELLVRPKLFEFPQAKLDFKVAAIGEGRFSLTVTGACLARRVKVSFEGIDVTDVDRQYFDVTDTQPITLTVRTACPSVTENELAAALKVISEADLVNC